MSAAELEHIVAGAVFVGVPCAAFIWGLILGIMQPPVLKPEEKDTP